MNINIENLHNEINEFENIIKTALESKFANYDPKITEDIVSLHFLIKWDLNNFIDSYIKGGVYEMERLQGVLKNLMDLKLQLYYISEVDMGLYNTLIYGEGFNKKKPLETPHLFLRKLSYDQSLIVKSRIVWERIMNVIYFLESGRQLADKSKRKKFFHKFLSENPKWLFMEAYEGIIGKYEDSYRSPEVHGYNGSFLRKVLLAERSINEDELLMLLNYATNDIWQNILCIVLGENACHFTDLHWNSDKEIDPKYLLRHK